MLKLASQALRRVAGVTLRLAAKADAMCKKPASTSWDGSDYETKPLRIPLSYDAKGNLIIGTPFVNSSTEVT